MPSPDLPAQWGVFHRLQAIGSSRRVDSQTLGRDEALTALSDKFGTGCDPLDPDSVQRQFDRLRVNRTAKYRRRVQLDRQIAENTQTILPAQHTQVVAIKELAELLHRETPEADWQILRMLADGFTYREIADQQGLSITNLKSRVFRVRCRLRSSPTGRQVQGALAAY